MPETENRRILIVDDEPDIRQGYRSFLIPDTLPPIVSSRSPRSPLLSGAPNGPICELIEAESGEQALEAVRQSVARGNRFVGAFVDVRMPGSLDGIQFIQEAWKLDPDMLMVVVTSYQDRTIDEIDRLFTAHFQDQWDYLSKPFTSSEIVQKARQLISSWNRRMRERAYCRQIEEQQEALIREQQLAAVGRLARVVGHEFGNVLQPLLTKLELLRDRAGNSNDPTLRPLSDEMLEATELAISLARDLLTFGREGRDSASEDVRLSTVVERTSRLLSHLLKKKDITVAVDVNPLHRVLCQETRMTQVLINLVLNAIEAMPEGGHLTITSSETVTDGKAWLNLEIADDGCGISPENLGRVFEPSFTTKGPRGNGLGLPICKRIMETYAGTIEIRSRQDHGTKVILHAPACTE